MTAADLCLPETYACSNNGTYCVQLLLIADTVTAG